MLTGTFEVVYTLLVIGKYVQERICLRFKFRLFFFSISFFGHGFPYAYIVSLLQIFLFCFSTLESCFCSI